MNVFDSKKRNALEEQALLLEMIDKAQRQLRMSYNSCSDMSNMHIKRAKRCYDIAIIQARIKKIKCPWSVIIKRILFFTVLSKI
ncbi:MAG: hypothetical protein PHP06_04810 [Clostridia bacterium]|nr:hypothetical protein [Clostridia bacterium]